MPHNTQQHDVRRLFDRTSELPVEQRGAFLDANCADLAVRRWVEELLRTIDSIPDTPRPGESPSETKPPDPALAGRAPAGYAVEAELGRGGMGVVYKAWHLGLDRACALKMILAGDYAAAQERQRFLTEARAISRLDHAGIVRLYDYGEHAGLPFMALELCPGGSLDKRLQRQLMNPREAAEAVRGLALAMQAAHEAKVIHRDLKPANVLIGADGAMKITDFGLAKKLDEPGLTQSGAIVGTPSYMAPEQARGQKDLGPAVDVWALGALLYECLTGRPPFRGATALDTLVQVMGDDPVSVRHLNPAIPADLATIVHKCLQREPAKRYKSAAELADDLGRFRNGEPIAARPVGTLERGGRWCRRNPAVAGLMAAVIALMVAGTAVSTAFGVQASLNADRAERKADDEQVAREAAEAAEAETARQLARAEANLKLAKKAVNDTFDLAKNHPLFQGEHMRAARKLMLEKALPFYKSYGKQKSGDRKAQAEVADHWWRVGSITAEIGDKREAREAFARAAGIYRTLLRPEPTHRAYQVELASTLNNIGFLLHAEGKRLEALQAYSEARDIQQRLADIIPIVPEYRHALARTLNNIGLLLSEEQGKRAETMEAYKAARGIQEELVKAHPENSEYQRALASTLNNMANVLKAEGKRTEALKAYKAARRIGEKLVDANPGVSLYQNDLARTLTNMGVLLRMDKKTLPKALRAHTAARDILRKLVDAYPAVTQYQHLLASALNNMANVLQEVGKRTESLKAFSAARDVLKELATINPDIPEYQNDLARTLRNIGALRFDEGKFPEALEAFNDARAILVKLVAANEKVVEYKFVLATTLIDVASCQLTGDPVEALKTLAAAGDILENLIQDNRAVAYLFALARTRAIAGSLRFEMKKPKKALPDLEGALKHLSSIRKIDPLYGPANDLLWLVLYNRARTLTALKRHAEAAADWGRFVLVAPPLYRTLGRLRRVGSLAWAGQVEDAMKEAETLADELNPPAAGHYNLACIAALCSVGNPALPLPRREHSAESCENKALTWLQAAKKAGYFEIKANRDRLFKDTDLAGLRNRDDFKQFLKSLDP